MSCLRGKSFKKLTQLISTLQERSVEVLRSLAVDMHRPGKLGALYYGLDKDDLLSFSTAKKFVSSPMGAGWRILFPGVELNDQILFFQLLCNSLVFIWQYSSSWTVYMITSFSGIKRLYRLFFSQPFFLISFITSLLLTALTNTDKHSLEVLFSLFQISKEEAERILSLALDTNTRLLFDALKHPLLVFAGYLSIDISDERILEIAQSLSKVVGMGVGIGIRGLSDKFALTALESLPGEKACIPEEAMYITFNDEDVQEFYRAITSPEYGKSLKGMKRRDKIPLLEVRKDGAPICLGECKRRAKTRSGTLCKKQCGSSVKLPFGLGNITDEWCEIEPITVRDKEVAKRGWDYCDSSKEVKACMTGGRWLPCE